MRVEIGLWQDTGGAGKTDAETLREVLAGYAVHLVDSFGTDPIEPKIDRGSSRAKRTFAKVWAPWVEQGRVYIRRAGWNGALLSEAHAFPHASHDDIIDGVSGAAQLLAGPGMGFWGGLITAARELQGARR